MNMESIYGLTFDQLAAWLLERGHKNFELRRSGIGFIVSGLQNSQKCSM